MCVCRFWRNYFGGQGGEYVWAPLSWEMVRVSCTLRELSPIRRGFRCREALLPTVIKIKWRVVIKREREFSAKNIKRLLFVHLEEEEEDKNHESSKRLKLEAKKQQRYTTKIGSNTLIILMNHRKTCII